MQKRTLTKQHKKNISKSLSGRIRTKEHCQNISKAKKGVKNSAETKKKKSIFWKKKWQDKKWKAKIVLQMKKRGLSVEHLEKLYIGRLNNPVTFTKESLKKKSISMKKWWLNPQNKKRMSLCMKGRIFSPEHKMKLRLHKRKHTEESKRKIGLAHKGKKVSENTKQKLRMFCGSLASGWKGGKSFEPYSEKFNRRIKREIREKYNFRCFLCNVYEKNLSRKLSVHHINYDKRDCNINNLIPLCNHCHSKTNEKREKWKNIFLYLVGENYGC